MTIKNPHPTLLAVVCLAALVLGPADAAPRIWTSGKHQIEGELAGFDAKTGMILIDTGERKVSVKVSALSRYDIEYLKVLGAPIGQVATTAKAPSSNGPAAKRSLEEEFLGKPLFLPYPTTEGRAGKQPWLVRHFGPVGIGISLERPGMTMKINNVEEGSPADQTNKLKAGQIIETINGQKLDEFDPRIQLGDILTEAEATDGRIVLDIKGEGEVTVSIPVMGRYSDSWPLNCEKSDKIVRNLADLLAQQGKPRWGSVIFLLSTGEDKDLAVVKRWMKDPDQIYGNMNWETGYKGPGLCEYYLRTGDQSVLPVIKRLTEQLRAHMFSGGWSGRGAPAAFTYSVGTGQVHASGVNCMSFLLMAKLCGVEVDDYMFTQTWQQFYRFAGHGNVAYGNTRPEGGFRDNGKTSGLAFGLGAAAMVDPAGENSFYARARDNSAMKAFYATNWFHAAHTGGGMGEIWHHTAMNQMREKRPHQYRSYFDTRRWAMDLSRRFDGSIGIAGIDDRYDRSASEQNRSWGTYFALTYTLPRKHLQLFGAPRSPWAKTMDIPRPWGNAADDLFHSIEPIPGGPLTLDELLAERVETHASFAVLKQLSDPKVTDEEIRKYLHHPEYGLRSVAVRTIVESGRDDWVLPLLRSADPRLRHCGLWAITGMFKGNKLSDAQVTDAMFAEVVKMINDPDEAWWVSLFAIEALARADVDLIAANRKRLLEFIDHKSVYHQEAAVTTLTKICTHPKYYETLLPELIRRTSEFRVDRSSSQTSRAIKLALMNASKKVKDFASPILMDVYGSIPSVLSEPNTGAVMSRGAKTVRGRIGAILQEVPGGEEFIRTLPKTTLKSHISGKDEDMYSYSDTFEKNDDLVGTWEWAVWPPASNPSEVDKRIQSFAKRFSGTLSKPKDTLQLFDDGRVKSKFYNGYFWSGNMLVGVNEDQALKMELRKRDGYDWLVVERGGFNTVPETEEDATASVPEDYHCGYHIYVRKKQDEKQD